MHSWREVEKNINEEINFLNNFLLPSPYHHEDPIKCSDCLFRQIAVLIVSGKIKAKEITYQNNSIWLSRHDNKTAFESDDRSKQHGAHWHYSMIKMIEHYFRSHGYSVQQEPNLYYGRADLGIKSMDLYIEVGTVNIYKLYNNLFYMTRSRIIIVPSDDYLIEFSL